MTDTFQGLRDFLTGESDELFGRIAVELGYLPRQALDDCLRGQFADANSRPPRIGQLLLERGLLSIPQVLEILRRQKRWLFGCPKCGTAFVFDRAPASDPPCLQCGRTLAPPQSRDALLGAFGPPIPCRLEGAGLALGKYRLRREIARGGMGVVFEAEDPDLRRRVALKVFRDVRPDEVERLRREAALAARLVHPNIVSVYEIGTGTEEMGESPVHFIAMELAEGGTLASRLDRFPFEEKLRVLETVAEAVGFAHEQGIVHRDLKPANILLRADGSPVVTDFGLARSEADRTALTATGAVLGTPMYMSPEQVRGRTREIGPTTDVWALGVVLYEALTGTMPFDGPAPADLYRRIQEEDPIPPSRKSSEIPSDLEAICLKALAKEPSRRYPNARALAEDLGRYRQGLPVHARPPSVAYRTLKWLRRRRTGVAAAGTVLVTLVLAFLAFSRWQRERAFRDHRIAAERAFASGEWAKAAFESERALRLRPDDRLAFLERRSRRRTEIEPRLVSLRERMNETRLHFYIRGDAIFGLLRQVETALADLRAILDDPDLSDSVEAWKLLGLGWYLVSDLERAEEALRRATPRDASARFLLGRVYLERAQLHLLAAERIPPDSEPERFARMAQELLESPGVSGELESVVASVYRAWASRDTQTARRLAEEGVRKFGETMGSEELHLLPALWRSGDDAMQACTRALAIRPHYPWALFQLALHQRAPREAERTYSAALQLQPRFVEARYNRSRARGKLGDLQGALDDLDECVRLRPRWPHVRFNRGNVLRERGEWDRAQEEFSEAIRLDPKYDQAYSNRGSMRRKRRDWIGALADFTRAIEIDPRHFGALIGRAEVRAVLGDIGGAFRDIEFARIQAPSNLEILCQRGAVFWEANMVELARRDLEEVAARDFGFPNAHYRLGIMHKARKDWAAAEAAYTRELARNPFQAASRHHRGLCRLERGDLLGALVDFDESIRVEPRSSPFRLVRGILLSRLRWFDLALEDFDAVLRRDPTHGTAYFHRGLVLEAVGKRDAALASYDDAIRWKSGFLPAHMARGDLRRRLGLLREASADFTEAIRLDPRSPDAYYLRALTLETLGDFPGAIADLERALARAQDDWWGAEDARLRLRRLKR